MSFALHKICLKSNGEAWTWGNATSGVLGDNSITHKSSPVSVVGNHSFDQISGNSILCIVAKANDGSCWSWGEGGSGQLGDNTITDKSSPVSVVGGHSFDKVLAGGAHALALKANDGSCWAWGNNTLGRLGDNTTTAKSSPISVVGNHSFDKIAAGSTHSTALKANDGSCWSWGAGGSGLLGDNTATSKSSPVSVVGNHSFDQISNAAHTLALKANDGSCWSWGAGGSGRLGDSAVSNRSSPVSVVGNHSFNQVSAGQDHSLALKANDGSCWAWGNNQTGELGDNQLVAARSSPVSVVGNHSFVKIYAANNCSFALKSDGSVWAWGDKTNGKLGNNEDYFTTSAEQIVGNHSFNQISGLANHSLVLKANDGSCWSWGLGSTGQLGDNTTTSKSSPVSVVGNHSFDRIAGGAHSLALKANDGSCWSWGGNSGGQLGDNTITDKSSPVSVVGNHSFDKIAAGTGHSLALKANDGSCWSWGANTFGVLGDNTTTNKSSPISVVGNHSFNQINRATWNSFALKANDGSCWSWGSGGSGLLGDNTATSKSSPVSVVGNHSFDRISTEAGHCLALKANDGSCWSWGANTWGTLGDNTITTRSSPVSVVGGHSFDKVSAGGAHSLALKANDGSCWSWGDNREGQLGDNSITGRSSPVSVVGNHSFIDISSVGDRSFGIKNDGTIWSWGECTNGALGNNKNSYINSPVQVVGNHTFSDIESGQINFPAIKKFINAFKFNRRTAFKGG